MSYRAPVVVLLLGDAPWALSGSHLIAALRLLLAYRSTAHAAERPEATAANHAAWRAAQAAYYAAGGRDPANGWPTYEIGAGHPGEHMLWRDRKTMRGG